MTNLQRVGAIVFIAVLFPSAVWSGQSMAEDSYDRGVQSALRGDFEDAEEHFKKAVSADPSHQSAQESLEVVQWVIRKKLQKEVAIHLITGLTHEKKDVPEKAIAEFDKAIAIAPEYYLAYYTRGFSYRSKGDPIRSAKDVFRARWLQRNKVASVPLWTVFPPIAQYATSEYSQANLPIRVSEFSIPSATPANPVRFQYVVCTQPNKLTVGPRLYDIIPTIYPDHLKGLQVTPLDLLSGAIGRLFIYEDGRVKAFMPVAIELPTKYWTESSTLVDVSSVKQFVEMWNILGTVDLEKALESKELMIVGSRKIRMLEFNSDEPTRTSFFKWPEKTPLCAEGVLIFPLERK